MVKFYLYTFATNCKSIIGCSTKVTKSFIPTANTPAQIIVPVAQSSVKIANELSIAHQKYGRPLSSKDNVSQKRIMKFQDPIKNKAQAINVLVLSKSPVLDKLMAKSP